MMGKKIILHFSEKIAFLACVNISVSVIYHYFWFFATFIGRMYTNDEEGYLRDIRIFLFVTIFVVLYFILEIIITIAWQNGSRKSRIMLFVTTMIHFIAQTFLFIRIFYWVGGCFSGLIVSLIIDSLLFIELIRNWRLEMKTNNT